MAGEPDRIGRALMFGSAGVSLATATGVPIGVALREVFTENPRALKWAVVGQRQRRAAQFIRVKFRPNNMFT